MEEKQVSIKHLRATEVLFYSVVFLFGLLLNSFWIKAVGTFGVLTFVVLYIEEQMKNDKTK